MNLHRYGKSLNRICCMFVAGMLNGDLPYGFYIFQQIISFTSVSILASVFYMTNFYFAARDHHAPDCIVLYGSKISPA